MLLILAGITIQVVLQGGIIGQANRASESYKIADLRDRIDIIRIAWIADKAVDTSLPLTDLWDRIIEADIIATRDDVEGPEKDESGNDIYILNTKDGYTVEIIVNDKGHVTIGDIVKGALPPVVRRIEATTTDTGITAKAIVSRLKNGTVEYWYKISSENDSEYKKMNFISQEEGAKVNLTLVEGTTYNIKAIAKNDAGEHELMAEITIGVKVKGLTLDKTAATVAPGGTLQLVPTITPENAENKKLTWSSSNPEIATVDENGLITAVTEGNAVITATTTDDSNLSATCNVTVKIPVESITLDKTNANIYTDETVTLVATVNPANATNKNITWSSSNEIIATVSSSGVVTGKAEGTVTITAASSDDLTKKASCSVKVSDEDDWEEIAKWAKQIAQSGISSSSETAEVNLSTGGKKIIKVGDKFYLKYGSDVLEVRILGFNHDPLASGVTYKNDDGTSIAGITKAGISFEFTEFLGSSRAVNSSGGSTNGWGGKPVGTNVSQMRTYLNGSGGTIGGEAAKLTSIKDYIKKVRKPYAIYGEATATRNCDDWLWLLSASEIWNTGATSGASYGYSKSYEGARYAFYAQNVSGTGANTNLVKKKSSGSAGAWWLRSPSYDGSEFFCIISSDGYEGRHIAYVSDYVAPGFCI